MGAVAHAIARILLSFIKMEVHELCFSSNSTYFIIIAFIQ